MAIFDFQCPICKYKVEYLAKSDENISCPVCFTKMNRLVSAPHFKFKGVNTGVDNPSSFKTKRHEDPIIPINFIDQLPDGTCRVSSTAKDPELLDE